MDDLEKFLVDNNINVDDYFEIDYSYEIDKIFQSEKRIVRSLKEEKIFNLGDLLKYSLSDIYKIPNIGRKSISIIKSTLLSCEIELKYDERDKIHDFK